MRTSKTFRQIATKIATMSIPSLVAIIALTALISRAEDGDSEQRRRTPEQLAAWKKGCASQAAAFKNEYQSAKAYFPVLMRFADELEKKMSNYERQNLERIQFEIGILNKLTSQCNLENGKPLALSCIQLNKSWLMSTNGEDAVHIAIGAFTQLLDDYNRSSPVKYQMKARSDRLNGVLAIVRDYSNATTVYPASASIRTHMGKSHIENIRAYNTKADVKDLEKQYLSGSVNTFIAKRLKQTYCDGFVTPDPNENNEDENTEGENPSPASLPDDGTPTTQATPQAKSASKN